MCLWLKTWFSVHENHRTHPTFPMARPRCLMRDYQISQIWREHIVGLVQKRRNSSALAMELRLSCTNPSIESPSDKCLMNHESFSATLLVASNHCDSWWSGTIWCLILGYLSAVINWNTKLCLLYVIVVFKLWWAEVWIYISSVMTVFK